MDARLTCAQLSPALPEVSDCAGNAESIKDVRIRVTIILLCIGMGDS